MRLLVVGCGSIGERHLRCFGRIPGVQTSICEQRPERAEELKSCYAVSEVFTQWGAVPLEEFDAVVVCVPAHLHVPFAVRALESGCHVLVEKPLSISLDGLDRLHKTLEESDKRLMVAYVYRCVPPMAWMKAQLEAGVIGQPLSAIAVSGQDFTFFRPDFRDIYYARRETGGGAVQDAVTHVLNYLEWILGPVSAVACLADHLWIPDVDVEDTVSLVLRFSQSPVVGSISLNQFQAPNESRIDICGSEGNLRYDGAMKRAGVFRRGDSDWSWDSPVAGERDDGFVMQARWFLNVIEKGVEPSCSLAQAEHTLKACLAALESAEQKRVIEVPE